jgi:hypothetical protein
MDQFKPGDSCPKSGIYDVVHDGVHQDKHQVTMVKGETPGIAAIVRDLRWRSRRITRRITSTSRRYSR